MLRFMLYAVTALVFAVSAVGAVAAPPKPPKPSRGVDLVVDQATLANTWYQSTETFDAGQCAAQEGVITPGEHKLIRFATLTGNIGKQAVTLGAPDASSPNWYFFECEEEWHFLPYASYSLVDPLGRVVGTGHKQGFCVEDTDLYSPWGDPLLGSPGHPAPFDCNVQGIHPGWADEYNSGLLGQWVVVDGTPPGTYTLKVTVNYAHALKESNYANNTTATSVTIS